MKKQQLTSYRQSWLSSTPAKRRFKAAIVSEGFLRAMGGQQSNRYIPQDVLQRAAEDGMFDALAVFVDHAGFFEYPEVERLVARTADAEWDDELKAVTATIEFYDRELANAMVNIFDRMIEDDNPPDVGFSLVFWGAYGEREKPDDPLILKTISHVESADIVFEPAAEGARVLEALSTKFQKTNEVNNMPPRIENNTSPEEENQEPVTQAAENDPGFDMDQLVMRVSERIEEQIGDSVSHAVADLQAHIDSRLQAAAEAEAVQIGGTPPRSPNIVMGLNGYEELELAARALLSGSSVPSGVRSLSGIRELYLLLSGDYEMTGLFQDERVQFAAVDSSTLANLFADALNKMVVEIGALFPRWWDPAVTVYNFNTLHDAKWIMMGGVGELPTVAEGSAYTELDLDDQQESDSFVKKGGYLGITLEAIDKDDTRRIQAIPRALVRAAWLTLGKAISTIFTTASGTGPTLDTDSTVLFHTNHSNLGTSVLSFTSWAATRALMMAQTEINSSEPLGALNAPSLLWVPAELEFTALQIMASLNEPGGANNDVNPEVMDDSQRARLEAARRRVIVSPFWTDTNNWAAQANPMLYPAIGLGYRFGENPEIYSVSDPRAGLMFTNDVMPVKVRYFYAVGPMDYRPLYKHNVT